MFCLNSVTRHIWTSFCMSYKHTYTVLWGQTEATACELHNNGKKIVKANCFFKKGRLKTPHIGRTACKLTCKEELCPHCMKNNQ